MQGHYKHYTDTAKSKWKSFRQWLEKSLTAKVAKAYHWGIYKQAKEIEGGQELKGSFYFICTLTYTILSLKEHKKGFIYNRPQALDSSFPWQLCWGLLP